jgi:hypothetical protein
MCVRCPCVGSKLVSHGGLAYASFGSTDDQAHTPDPIARLSFRRLERYRTAAGCPVSSPVASPALPLTLDSKATERQPCKSDAGSSRITDIQRNRNVRVLDARTEEV